MNDKPILDRRQRDELERDRAEKIARSGVGDAMLQRAFENSPATRDNTSRWIFAAMIVAILIALALLN